MLHSMTTPEELASTIGARVRSTRIARAWTLDALAESSGISRRMLVNIEHGTANPSLATLLRLSDALGVGLPALVEGPRTDTVSVTPAGTGSVLWTGEAGGTGTLVTGTGPPDVVELWDWTLGPGDAHTSEAHAAGTTELLHVISGHLRLTVGSESFDLSPGDAARFPGDVPHRYANADEHPCRFALTVFEPDVGTGSRP